MVAIAAGVVSGGCGVSSSAAQSSQSQTKQASDAARAGEPSSAAGASGEARADDAPPAPAASNPIALFIGGDTPGAIESLVAWSASPADAREPVLLMDPITEAEFAGLGAAHMQRLEVMMEESKVLRQLAGAAVREARSLAPTDPVRAAQLLDAVERAGFIHRTAGANNLTTMVGEAIEKLAHKARVELLPDSGTD